MARSAAEMTRSAMPTVRSVAASNSAAAATPATRGGGGRKQAAVAGDEWRSVVLSVVVGFAKL
ncbi:unnamed protein product [Cuscuta epithymum]|uniref:Uncharacterized protein n=1 Tax=Cuscuta epithymum TaxID=186058 RepID=A0AAV0CF79_9ASTE|nr:unnamed protein product [Cuscuta epithymum]